VVSRRLQYLALKLGTVTGLDLAQMNNKHLPRWLELIVYFVAEACIICTDISQVVGTAFAWSLLIPQLPLVWACVLTAADTLLILLFYSPTGQLRRIRIFEVFVAGLVIAVFITVCIALSQVSAPPGPVFKGFLPSREIFVSQGLYTSCAILGGALMPHALYVGSSVARPRLLAYDVKYQITTFQAANAKDPGAGGSSESLYRPSLRAIRSCLSYSTWELTLTIFIVAIFVNSALIIVSGATFYNSDADFDDLYSLYALFQDSISDVAATIFAVSLLFSGVSAGIVATMAGQTVMEAAWQIRVHPFWRRLITRSVAIIPALIICTADGEYGMAQALVACNYVLAIGLIFVTLPLVWYVTHERYMLVPNDNGTNMVSFRNSVIGIGLAWFIWVVVVFMDVATIVLLGLGLNDD
jgi:metal iron transporter